MFGFDVSKGTTKQAERQITTSLIDITEVRGRKQEKDTLVNILLSDSSQSKTIPTVSVVGMGGIGKTTVAQLAFKFQ